MKRHCLGIQYGDILIRVFCLSDKTKSLEVIITYFYPTLYRLEYKLYCGIVMRQCVLSWTVK